MRRRPILFLEDDQPLPAAADAPGDTPVAVGGGLRPERLLEAYSNGIFPWELYRGHPVWWSPDPRFLLFPDQLRVPRSLERVIRAAKFEVSFNRDFRAVMEACRQTPRAGQRGTWIAPEMVEAYTALHAAGQALSVEVWHDGVLAGGLYGVRLGRSFAGESMFARQADASKVGFVTLVRELLAGGCDFIDCQVYTEHLARFGAVEVPRREFLELLAKALRPPAGSGPG